MSSSMGRGVSLFTRSYRASAVPSSRAILSSRATLRHYSVEADKAPEAPKEAENDAETKLKAKDDEIADLTVRRSSLYTKLN
jgi:hypothetical protein